MDWAFGDTSALIPLCVREASTTVANGLGGKYSKTVWWATCVECGSFARLRRGGTLSSPMEIQAQIRLEHLRRAWREISPTDELRDRAEDHVRRFGLTGADAFQLAAAWIWCTGSPRGRLFIAGDLQLLAAAEELGFSILRT